MSRIASTFATLKAQNKKALIPFVTAGFPFADITPDLMHHMVQGGADLIELGVPFSDPCADGPVIQKAGEKALALGVGMTQVLQMVRHFREKDTRTPVVLMGYANPIEAYNLRSASNTFAQDAAAAGVDGVLVVDYPPEESHDFAAQLRQHGLDLIFLLAPTSTTERMEKIAKIATGYVYYVSLKGVTGAANLDLGTVNQMLDTIRQHVHIPVGVGFGIRDAATAQAVGRTADAVVIGSKLIELLESQPRSLVLSAAQDFLQEIRNALDAIEPASAQVLLTTTP